MSKNTNTTVTPVTAAIGATFVKSVTERGTVLGLRRALAAYAVGHAHGAKGSGDRLDGDGGLSELTGVAGSTLAQDSLTMSRVLSTFRDERFAWRVSGSGTGAPADGEQGAATAWQALITRVTNGEGKVLKAVVDDNDARRIFHAVEGTGWNYVADVIAAILTAMNDYAPTVDTLADMYDAIVFHRDAFGADVAAADLARILAELGMSDAVATALLDVPALVS